MENRLLTDEEKEVVYDSYGVNTTAFMKAQDAKTEKYYEDFVIPAKMAEAYGEGAEETAKTLTAELIEEIDNQRDNICCVGEATTLCHLADPCCSFMRETCTWWQQLKQKRGI